MEKKAKKILIVDDNISILNIYINVFKKAGFKILNAEDGLIGLDIATKEIPDIIFTGIIMPRMDGFAFMEALKKNVITAKIPVVISSHLGREEDRIKANKLGAKDFIIRTNTSPNQVVNRIKNIFTKKGRYDLEIDFNSVDVQRLLNDFNLNSQIKCPKCNRRTVLRLKLYNYNLEERSFKIKFACTNCNKELD